MSTRWVGVAHRMQHRRQEVLLETFWALGLKVSWALGLKVSSCKEKVSSCKDSERSADEVRRWVGVAHRMQHRRQGSWERLRLTVPPPLAHARKRSAV